MGNVFGKRRARSLSVSETVANGHCGVSTNNSKSNYGIDTVVTTKKLVSPFVYQRKSDLFVDEDGDVAHEFYDEVPAHRNASRKRTLVKRPLSSLKPVGLINYDIPRLHSSFPYIMVEISRWPS